MVRALDADASAAAAPEADAADHGVVAWPARPLGFGAGCLLAAIATVALIPLRGNLAETSPALVLVLPVVVAGIVGGRVPAVLTGVVASAIYSVVFIKPYDSYKIAVSADAVTLGVFVAVALLVGTLVAREADRRRAAEDQAVELRRLHAQYEAVVSERERLTAEANRVALVQRVDEQRSALLRSVSHDLRTPLATIRAVATDLRGGAVFDDRTRDDLLELVADEAERLNRIVENLLNLSRIEAGALQPDRQAIAFEELVKDRSTRLSRLFGTVRVEARIPADLPFLDADYVQLDLVLTNLLENAARFAPPSSVVSVEANVVGKLVEVAVSDQGPGVSSTAREHLFEPFGATDRRGGSGVGLAICRSIVEAHGGTIRLDHASGSGARFVFTMPVREG